MWIHNEKLYQPAVSDIERKSDLQQLQESAFTCQMWFPRCNSIQLAEAASVVTLVIPCGGLPA